MKLLTSVRSGNGDGRRDANPTDTGGARAVTEKHGLGMLGEHRAEGPPIGHVASARVAAERETLVLCQASKPASDLDGKVGSSATVTASRDPCRGQSHRRKDENGHVTWQRAEHDHPSLIRRQPGLQDADLVAFMTTALMGQRSNPGRGWWELAALLCTTEGRA